MLVIHVKCITYINIYNSYNIGERFEIHIFGVESYLFGKYKWVEYYGDAGNTNRAHKEKNLHRYTYSDIVTSPFTFNMFTYSLPIRNNDVAYYEPSPAYWKARN